MLLPNTALPLLPNNKWDMIPPLYLKMYSNNPDLKKKQGPPSNLAQKEDETLSSKP